MSFYSKLNTSVTAKMSQLKKLTLLHCILEVREICSPYIKQSQHNARIYTTLFLKVRNLQIYLCVHVSNIFSPFHLAAMQLT
jgi:hypothetical protein